MLKSKKRTLVIGGSGYIGIRIVKELLNRDYQVTIASRNPQKVESKFKDKKVGYLKLDIYDFNGYEIEKEFKKYDSIVFAAGVDDRLVPKAPAYDFFYNCNVRPCMELFKRAGRSGVRKVVLLSSYFCYYNRTNPELKLDEHHPYIRARMDQENESIRALDKYDTDIVILEIPYVLGSSVEEDHLLKPLVKYLYFPLPIFVTHGGSAVITVENVSEAVVNSIERDLKKKIYPIADLNMSWKEIWMKINPKRKSIVVPKWLLKFFVWFLEKYYKITNKESGLNLVEFMDLHTRFVYIPIEDIRNEIGYSSDGLDASFDEIVKNSLAN